jgi:hypothetical protein
VIVEYVALGLGAATLLLGAFLARREMRRGRIEAMRSVMRTDEAAKAAVRALRDTARRSLRAQQDIRTTKAEIVALDAEIAELRARLGHPDLAASYVLVLSERRKAPSAVAYVAEVEDQRGGGSQRVMVWDDDKKSAAERIERRFPVSAGFRVGETALLRPQPKPVTI